MPCSKEPSSLFYIHKEKWGKSPVCQQLLMGIDSICFRFNAEAQNNFVLPDYEEFGTFTEKDGDGFAGFQNWSENKESQGILALVPDEVSAAKQNHYNQQCKMNSPDSFCHIPAHLTPCIKRNAGILWANKLENNLVPSCGHQHKLQRMGSESHVILRNHRIHRTKTNHTKCSSAGDNDAVWLLTKVPTVQTNCHNAAAVNRIWEENFSNQLLTKHGLPEISKRAGLYQKGDVTPSPDMHVTTMLDRSSAQHRPSVFVDKRGYLSAMKQVDTTVSPFSAAIRWMYGPLGPASATPVLTQRALRSGGQRGHAEGQGESVTPRGMLAAPVPAGRTVRVSRPTRRVTRDVRHVTRLQSPRTRSQPAQADTCCCCDLRDDTDPSLGFSVTVVSERGQWPDLRSRPFRKRVYRIKQPRTLPHFGCVTPSAQKSGEAAAGEDRITRTKAANSGATAGKERPLVHFVENVLGGRTWEREGGSQRDQTPIWDGSDRDSLQNEAVQIKREEPADVKDVAVETAITTAAAATTTTKAETSRPLFNDLIHQAAHDEWVVCSDHAHPSDQDYIADETGRQRLVRNIDTAETDGADQQETDEQQQRPRHSVDCVIIPDDINFGFSDAAGNDVKFPVRGEQAPGKDESEVSGGVFSRLNSAWDSPSTSETSIWSFEENDPSVLDALARECSTASWESRGSRSTSDTVVCKRQENCQDSELRQISESRESEPRDKLKPAEHLSRKVHSEEKDNCPGDISGPNAELSFEGGKKNLLKKMSGSKRGVHSTESTDSPSSKSSDATDKDVSSAFSGSASCDCSLQTTSTERESRTTAELKSTAGEECGKVKNKAIYQKFFSSSADNTEDTCEKKPVSVNKQKLFSRSSHSMEDEMSARKLQERLKEDSASSDDSKDDDDDGDDYNGGELSGPSAFQRLLLTNITSMSDSGIIDRSVSIHQHDLSGESGSETVAASRRPGGGDRHKNRKGRGRSKLLPARASKSYDITTDSKKHSRHYQRSRQHFCSFSESGLPYESDSEVSGGSSGRSADSSVSGTHSLCSSDDEREASSENRGRGGDVPGSTDRKHHGLVTWQSAGSEGSRSSCSRNAVAVPARCMPQSSDPMTAVPAGLPVPVRRSDSVRSLEEEADAIDNSVSLARAGSEEMETKPAKSVKNVGKASFLMGTSKPRGSQPKNVNGEDTASRTVTAARSRNRKQPSGSKVTKPAAAVLEDGSVGQCAAEGDGKASTTSAVERHKQQAGRKKSENDKQDRRKGTPATAADTKAKRDGPVARNNASVSVIRYDGTAGSVSVSRAMDSGSSVKVSGSPRTAGRAKTASPSTRVSPFGNKSLISSRASPTAVPSVDTAAVQETSAFSVVQRECADDSYLTVVTPLAEPPGMSTSTPLSSDDCTVTETDSSEPSRSAITTDCSDVTATERDSEISGAFPEISGEDAASATESIYEPLFLLRLARVKRAQSVPPEKPPRKPQPSDCHPPTARSASLEVGRDDVYDVPPSRQPVKFPKDMCLPSSVLLLKNAFESEDTVALHSVKRPQYRPETIPDDENIYVNQNVGHHRENARTKAGTSRDRKLSDASDSSVSGESEKSLQTRRSRFPQKNYITNACVTQPKNKMSEGSGSSRQESGESLKESSKVTEHTDPHRDDDQEARTEEAVVYANSSALVLFQTEMQRERERGSPLQEGRSLEVSPPLSDVASSKDRMNGAKALRSVTTPTSSSDSEQKHYEEAKPKLILKRGGGEGSLGKSGSARKASVSSGDDGSRDRGDRSNKESISSASIERTSDSEVAGTSEVIAVQALADATTGDSARSGTEEDDEASRAAADEGTDQADAESTGRENSLEKDHETSVAPEGTPFRSGAQSHIGKQQLGSQDNDGYEDVHTASQQAVGRGTDTPAPATAVAVVGVADGGGNGSPPVPEPLYFQRRTKYNEYSNIVRIDSEKVRAARAKSSSAHTLFMVPEGRAAPSAAALRKAISMEEGLDTKTSKKRRNRNGRPADEEERGSGKRKRHFSFQKLLSLFRKKRKKQKTETRTGDEEAETSAEGAAGGKAPETGFSMRKFLGKRKKPKPDLAVAVNSAHDANDIRPIGRLLQLNADGTQLVELIRSQEQSLGVVLAKGSAEEEAGVFVSGFTDGTTEKLLSGILNVGDEIVKVNNCLVGTSSVASVYDMIMGQPRTKLVTVPVQGK